MLKVKTDYKFRQVPENSDIKIALIGDACTGKTTAILNYVKKIWIDVDKDKNPNSCGGLKS